MMWHTTDPDFWMTEEGLSRATSFHGHRGSFLIVGLRMGALILKELNTRGQWPLRVRCFAARPPVSCFVDGVQLSTGCTLGKGNISTEDMDSCEARAELEDERGIRVITVRLKDDVRKRIESSFGECEEVEKEIENYLLKAQDQELFEITKYL
ncbi:MAG: formylmethanofuran dehydrogenase subunit E family protein [candidate division WOR-3 bacterium]